MRYMLRIPLIRMPLKEIFGAANLYTLSEVKIMDKLKHFLGINRGMDQHRAIGQLNPPRQNISSRIRATFTKNPRMETSIGLSHKIRNFFSNLTSGKSQSRDQTEKSLGIPAQHIRKQPVNYDKHNSIDPIEDMLKRRTQVD
jgi:hypothetical protein